MSPLATGSSTRGVRLTVRFSVFIPIFNDARWLPGAVESLLAQTHGEWELVIGDNVSSEDIAELVGRYPDERIVYHRWPTHVSFADNANRTIGLCRYEWLQYLSADDRLHPDCLARMAARVGDLVDVGVVPAMVLTGCRRLDEWGFPAEATYFQTHRLKRISDGLYDAREWLRITAAPGALPWNIGSLAISRDVLSVLGGYFRSEIGLTPDVEMALRVSAYGPVAYLAEPLLNYTVRDDSITGGLSYRNLAGNATNTIMGSALLSGLAVHEDRGTVSRADHDYVMRMVAESHVGRALQRRYRPGGHGRRGALRDIRRALLISPGVFLSARQLLRALAAIVAPSFVIRRTKAYFMRRGRWF